MQYKNIIDENTSRSYRMVSWKWSQVTYETGVAEV